MGQRFVLSLAAVAAFCLAFVSLTTLDRRGEAAVSREAVFTAPILTSVQVSVLAGGFRPAISDLYWIRAISAGEDILDTEAGQWHLFNLLMGTTAADPAFEPPFQYGAMILSVVGGRPDLADLLCARAELAFPDKWEYPFYRGFFRLYHDLNFAAAALHLDRAATRPEVPPYIKSLARRLRMRQNDPRMVLELIDRLERTSPEPEVRVRMQIRRSQIVSQLRERAG
ncbi:MAG: hypothetical protein OEY97_03690 [Nitrospirota bacterium]|nr:hypothetical protein [Nitrospirota bacterium]